MRLELEDCIRIIYDAHSCMEEGCPYDTELVQRALEEIGGSSCKYSEYIEQKCKEVEEQLAEDIKHVKHVRPFVTIHYDGKPTHSGTYLVKLTYSSRWSSLMYSEKFERWNTYDGMQKEYAELRMLPDDRVEAWIELDEIDGKEVCLL